MWQSYGKGKTRAELQAAHNAASTPKHIKGDTIKAITVVTDRSKITVYSNTNTLWIEILMAFEDKGLTLDDFNAWKIGVTAGK